MQQKDADEWKHKEDDGKTTPLEDIQSDVYFCSISHMTHSIMTQQTFMTQLILIRNMTHIQLTCCQSSSLPIYPIVHMISHVIFFFSNIPALSFEFVIFPSWLCFTLTNAVFHPYSCCASCHTSLTTMRERPHHCTIVLVI